MQSNMRRFKMVSGRGFMLAVVMVLVGLTGWLVNPAGSQAQEDLDTTLARSAARGFLTTLTRPDLKDIQSFYLLESVDLTGVMEELADRPIRSFQVTQEGWIDGNTYQMEARLQPVNRTMVVYTGRHDSRWKVEGVELLSLSQARPVSGGTPSTQPVVTLPTTPTVQPIDNGLSGLIAFQTHSGSDIYVINADGTGLRRVTHGIDPQLSPDGKQIAFTRWEPDYALFTINVDGTDERRWAAYWRQMKSPSWSADGRRLVFSYQNGGDLNEEWVIYNPKTLARKGKKPPEPPPRNRIRDFEIDDAGNVRYKIAPDAYWHLHQIDMFTGEYIDTPTGSLYSYGSSFHPTDPHKIIFRGDKGLGLYDVNERTSQRISNNVGDKAGVISPDGQKVTFSFWQDGNHWEVHTINLDGSNRQQLTQMPTDVIANRQITRQEVYINEEGFRTLRTTQPEGQPNNDWQWHSAAPIWSPDGSQILFMTNRTGKWEIWIMEADGSNQRPMFTNGAIDHLTLQYDGVDERMLSWRLVQDDSSPVAPTGN